MNFLSHLLLSGENPEVKFGNFIGDSVKGHQFEKFPENIQKGILLHRFIDSYTDKHTLVKASKKLLKPKFGHYRGVIIDVFFDHYLSVQWADYCKQSIPEFLSDFEVNFNDYKHLLSPSSLNFYSRFIELNYMANYAYRSGIEHTLLGLEKRIRYRIPLAEAMDDFDKNYVAFEDKFGCFFPELKTQCELKRLNELKPNNFNEH